MKFLIKFLFKDRSDIFSFESFNKVHLEEECSSRSKTITKREPAFESKVEQNGFHFTLRRFLLLPPGGELSLSHLFESVSGPCGHGRSISPVSEFVSNVVDGDDFAFGRSVPV